MQEIYVSTDVETDGPIPGPHSMLSMGSAAYSADKTLISTFSANLDTLEGAEGHPRNMEFWAKEPEAWAICRKDTRPAAEVMVEYAAWLKALPGRPIFVGYPLGFDFAFIYWYLHKFAGESPFGHNGIDMKTLSMALMKTDYRGAGKHRMPQRWFDESPHTHVALDDAIEQGALFCNMLAELHATTPK